MAIVEMKRLSLLAMRADRERLLQAMQRMGCVQLTEMPEEYRDLVKADEGRIAALEGDIGRIEWALEKLRAYDTYFIKPAFGAQPEVPDTEAEGVYAQRDEVFAAIKAVEDCEARVSELRSAESRARAAIAQYEPWKALDDTPERLVSTRDVTLRAGTMPEKNIPAAQSALEGMPAVIERLASLGGTAYVVIAAHRDCREEAKAAVDQYEFTEESFAQSQGMTPGQYVKSLEDELAHIERERADIQTQMDALSKSIPQMKILHDVILSELKRCRAAGNFAATERTFLATGWVPADKAERLSEKLKAISPSVTLEYRDPTDDEEPPIQLRNGKFAAAFEPVVEGFSLPAYRGFDPTAVMAPFYATLFGLMLSDAGYGLLMAVFIPIFMKVKGIRFKDAKMLYLLTIGGAFTVFWGIVLNTVLGFAPVPRLSAWFPLDPIGNSLPVMALCIGVGAVHLFAGLACAAYMNIKRGNIIGMISGQLAWVLLLCGLGMLVLPATKQIGMIMAIAGAALILLFTKNVKNPFKRIIGGLGALYGITSWVSDLLSYMRLFGMGLATGVIGMVFNNLIGMVWGGGIIGKLIAVVLFVGCHAFNIGINALGAYVHSCRLQYIEFFGKFYEEGGQPFRPLDNATRYVSIASPQSER